MDNVYPIANLFGYRANAMTYEFLGRRGKIEISGYSSRKLEMILRCMNGQISVNEIAHKVKQAICADEVYEVIEALFQAGVVTDSRYLFQQFQIDSANPSKFVHNLSNEQIAEILDREAFSQPPGQITLLPCSAGQVLSLSRGRKSERVFSGEQLEMEQLSNLLSAMYGVVPCRPVPSAGGLYPMALFVQVLSGVRSLQRGLYQYFPQKNSMVFRKSIEAYKFFPIFDSVSLCEKSSILILVVANLSHLTQKYANRGYRYALIEAGHICQNAYLSCVEQDIGVVEIGGYKDEGLANLLGLDYPRNAVLSSLFVGKKATRRRASTEIDTFHFSDLSEKMIVQEKLVKSVEVIDLTLRSYEPNFVAAKCIYRNPGRLKNDYSFASGRTSSEAQFKALVEAYERIASSRIRWDVVSAPRDLAIKWLDPRKYLPFRRRQVTKGIVPPRIQENRPIEWVYGNFMKGGEKILVPVEMVYYPLNHMVGDRFPTYRADSSGVAAHTNLNDATRNAFFELIERDALMLHWHCNLKPTKVPYGSVPPSVQESIENWKALGVCVELLDIAIDSIPVVLVFIHSPKMKPYCVSGAAAALDYKSAIQKSFAEAELMWLSWRNVRIPKLEEQNVSRPTDHGVLYMRKDYQEMLGGLLRCKESNSQKSLNLNPEKLFDPIRVIIDEGNNPYNLRVVRVLSSSLIPINFGFGTECWKHPRAQSLGLIWKRRFPSRPHFFA